METAMSDHAGTTGQSLPLGHVPHVGRVCQVFEEALRAGQRPLLEQYLRDASLSARGPLLRELLRLDLAYRSRAREKPNLEEYRLRFPDDADLIRAVFREMPTAAAVPPPIPLPAMAPANEPARAPTAA